MLGKGHMLKKDARRLARNHMFVFLERAPDSLGFLALGKLSSLLSRCFYIYVFFGGVKLKAFQSPLRPRSYSYGTYRAGKASFL